MKESGSGFVNPKCGRLARCKRYREQLTRTPTQILRTITRDLDTRIIPAKIRSFFTLIVTGCSLQSFHRHVRFSRYGREMALFYDVSFDTNWFFRWFIGLRTAIVNQKVTTFSMAILEVRRVTWKYCTWSPGISRA